MEFAQEYRIRSSWTVRATAGDPIAAVRVRNLQAVIQAAAHDAWGREGKAQPLLVSAEVSFAQPFDDASAGDRVGADTVHYGNLSKAILACLEPLSPHRVAAAAGVSVGGAEGQAKSSPPNAFGTTGATTLRGVLERVWTGLTGLQIDGIPCGAGAGRSGDGKSSKGAFLDVSKLRSLSVTLMLPKASLLGEGVSLTAMSVFQPQSETGHGTVEMFGLALRLHRLRVPTLIGVNNNERLSKQVVIADVEVDKFDFAADVYTVLEGLVVKIMDESSFETLEALSTHMANRIMVDFKPLPGQSYSGYFGWQLKIELEKPTAVPFADGPVIQIRAGAGSPPQSTSNSTPN